MVDFEEVRNGDGCLARGIVKRLAVSMFPEKAKAFDGRGIGGNLTLWGLRGLNWSLRIVPK